MEAKKCRIGDVQHLVEDYLRGLSSPIDSFLEDHILASTFYRIRSEHGETEGYYAVHKGELLTQFYVRRPALKHAQTWFNEVIERHDIKSLFVPTCDELLVSLAVDKDFKINKQGCFFQEGSAELPEEGLRPEESFRPAFKDDLAQILQICGDFLDRHEQRIEDGQLFVYRRGEELLGIGVMERARLLEGAASIGMFTNEAFRKQGIGRTVIVQLRKWCAERGIKPVSGCWYYNEASKRTLESAGMVTRTRLLNIETGRA